MSVTRSQIEDETYVPARSQQGARSSRQRRRGTGVIVGVALLRATVADPSFARAYLNLGLLLFDANDTAGSATALSKAVQLDPTLSFRIPETARPAA